MPYSSATLSAVIPIWYSLKASDKPSLIMVSTTFESPIRPPQRKLGKTYGAWLMFSAPPATIISASPHRIAWAANCTAFKPEPQTLLIVKAGVNSGSPAWTLIWRATFCPKPAPRIFPIITSSTCSGLTLAFSKTLLITKAPKSTAETFFKLPPKEPIGVRTAETITTSFITVPIYTFYNDAIQKWFTLV